MTKTEKYILGISTGILGIGLYLTLNKKKPKFIGRNIIIGDSHAVGISRSLNNVEKSSCAVGGWMLSNLIECINNQPIQNDVAKVFISIGTNGLYSASDKIEDLVKLLKYKFPNATLYVYGGSYGWSGRLSISDLENRRNKYYQRFASQSVKVLKNGLGYFSNSSEAHTTSTPQARAIISEIDSIVN